MESPRIRFKFVIPTYNAFPWIRKCLQSVVDQQYRHFDVCVVDDASTNSDHLAVLDEFKGLPNWTVVCKGKNEGPLASRVTAIGHLNCQDDDVLVFLDGDDWLAGPRVLNRLSQEYAPPDVLIVHSQTLRLVNRQPAHYRGASWWTRVSKSFRKEAWYWGHLFTGRYLLWRHIKNEDLRDTNGLYYRVCTDRAFTYPMLEMAGNRIRFVPEILHIYNEYNPLNCYEVVPDHHRDQIRSEILVKPKYPTLRV